MIRTWVEQKAFEKNLVDASRKAWLLELAGTGMNLSECQQMVGGSQTLIYDLRKKYGVEFDTAMKLAESRFEGITKDYLRDKLASGVTVDQIAKEHGVYSSSIYRRLRKYCLVVPSRLGDPISHGPMQTLSFAEVAAAEMARSRREYRV